MNPIGVVNFIGAPRTGSTRVIELLRAPHQENMINRAQF